ncbi:ARM repeat-containing protein [Hypoxylon rubiginosum]|uniref:ARM repeat-containing protein n=1 Tax=Hypoxylon rubiginosum TaxID=110542 RepID=A0ACB9ZHV4_9PEZI|nr:ARM repeat-containing protein [Hypoxylon rubiginosum]
MTTATRPNGFPNLAMGNASNEKGSQPLGSTFSHSAWQSGGIWGNSTMSLNSRRDVMNSRESDETSPSAVSGSAQLNSHSQAAPWVSRGGIWNQTGSAHPGSSSSGSTSPTRTRDSFQHNYTDVQNNSHGFQLRPPVSQNGSAPPNRTVAPGPLDPSTSSFKYSGGYGDSAGDDRGNSNLYASNSNGQLDFEAASLYRRNSNDPTYNNLGHSRQGTLTSRQAESSAQTPSHQYGDNSHYFSKIPGHTKQQTQRPSISGNSIALPSELGRSNAFGFGTADASTRDLEESFRGSLSLEDNSESINGGYAANGHFNPASQPFQLDPGSQPWQHDIGPSNSMGFNQNMPESSWADPVTMALKNARRIVAVGERGSPAGSSYRTSVNSPRGFSGTPNARADPWSRPGSRDPRMLQELDRAQHGSQYLNQQPGFYPPNYYNTNLSQFSAPYDQYVQNPNFRSQVQLPGFGLPVNYLPGLPVPARPSRDQDPGKGMRSAVLEEFRSNAKSNKRYELKDIYNYIVEFSGDQHGSRFIQEKLQTANSDEKDQVFREIEPNTLQLMKDVFGNYVIQKFFEHGNQVQKKIIAAQMKGKVAELSTQMYACRVVQKALEHVLVEQQTEIVEELKPDIMRIVKDQNGNHVIQKIIQMVPRLCIPFIMDAFQSQIESLASHNYGCRVIQRILEHGTEAEKKSLMTDLHTCAARLITDQYGNYVTQHIIAQGEPEDRRLVIQLVLQKLLVYSRHKFASNVVEKSIEYGTNEDRRAIRIQLTSPDNNGNNQLQLIMRDQFGNYVIQKLMQHLEGSDRESFIEEMRPHFASLKKHSTGRQITALDRLMSASSAGSEGPSFANSVTGMSSAGPTTPSLQVEVNSAAPTPSLTMEQNSPESSSPPSTNASIEESVDENNSKISPPGQPCPAVEVNES